MTIAEFKKKIENLPDDTEMMVYCPNNARYDRDDDYETADCEIRDIISGFTTKRIILIF